jgi:uracil-DNA glycosylase
MMPSTSPAASPFIPPSILKALDQADPSWHPTLLRALAAMAKDDPLYLPALASDQYLPNQNRLLAAFAQPIHRVRHVLVGEGPYPRAESATGVCFMDGAVKSLWSDQADGGLSKAVNRATSLRNFIKMLLVADGKLILADTGASAIAPIAAEARAGDGCLILSLAQLQHNLTAHGFLLLNATLVFRPHVPPTIEAKAWLTFLTVVLESLLQRPQAAPTLVLWGKIAEAVDKLAPCAHFPRVVSEHPYNLSFIGNRDMQALFGPLRVLCQAKPA